MRIVIVAVIDASLISFWQVVRLVRTYTAIVIIVHEADSLLVAVVHKSLDVGVEFGQLLVREAHVLCHRLVRDCVATTIEPDVFARAVHLIVGEQSAVNIAVERTASVFVGVVRKDDCIVSYLRDELRFIVLANPDSLTELQVIVHVCGHVLVARPVIPRELKVEELRIGLHQQVAVPFLDLLYGIDVTAVGIGALNLEVSLVAIGNEVPVDSDVTPSHGSDSAMSVAEVVGAFRIDVWDEYFVHIMPP
jgi:hypothetical protein